MTPLNRSRLAVVGLALSCVLVGGTTASADPILSIDPNPATISAVGNTTTVNVNVSDVFDLYSFYLVLLFDPAIVTVAGVTEGAFVNSGGLSFNYGFDNPAGSAFAYNSLLGMVPGVSGAGTLFSVTFMAMAPGQSSITFHLPDYQDPDELVMLLDSDIALIWPWEAEDGSVTVVPEPGSLMLFGLGLAGALARSRRRREER